MSFYIIPSPIGNLDDFTIRAINTIKGLDFLVVENKSSAQKLLKKFGVTVKDIYTYNDHSNDKDRHKIIKLLTENKTGGLVSEAGTPLISDPGYKLILEIINQNIRVIPLPGPSSVITALVASGLPTDKFQFFGFLPKKEKDLHKTLTQCVNCEVSSIFFESSHRIYSTLKIIEKLFGKNANVCVAKEISKMHENFFRGSAEEIIAQFDINEDLKKGEFIILIKLIKLDVDMTVPDTLFAQLSHKISTKELAKLSSDITGLNKNLLYERFLSFSKKS